MMFKFRGAAVRLVMMRADDLGQLRVQIDGIDKGTIDLFKKNRVYEFSRLFDNLGDKKHKLLVTVLGSKKSKSKGAGIVIDALQVAEKRSQETDRPLIWNKWKNKNAAQAAGGAFRYSGKGSVSVTFEGTSVQWLTAHGPGYGQADVFINGVQQGSRLDLYAPVQQWQVPVEFSGLPWGTHTIEIRATGARNVASTGNVIVVDGFLIPADYSE